SVFVGRVPRAAGSRLLSRDPWPSSGDELRRDPLHRRLSHLFRTRKPRPRLASAALAGAAGSPDRRPRPDRAPGVERPDDAARAVRDRVLLPSTRVADAEHPTVA